MFSAGITAGPIASTVAGASTGGATAPSGGGSSVGASMAWSGGAAAVSSICSTISAGISYHYQQKIIGYQKSMMKNRIKHNENMSKIDRDDQLAVVGQQEKNLHMSKEMHAESLKVKEELAKAEGDGRIIDAKLKEKSLTKKAGEINKKKLGKVFDLRNRYNMGKPKTPANMIEGAKHLA